MLESFGFPLRLRFVVTLHLQQFSEMPIPELDQGPGREMLGDETLANRFYVQAPGFPERDMPRRRNKRGRDRGRLPVVRPPLRRIPHPTQGRLPGTLRNVRGRRRYRRALNAAPRPRSGLLRRCCALTVHVPRSRKRNIITPSPTRREPLPTRRRPAGRTRPQRGRTLPPVRPKHIRRPHHRLRLPRLIKIPLRRNKIPRRITRRKQRLRNLIQEPIPANRQTVQERLRRRRARSPALAHFLPAAAKRRPSHGRRRLFTLRFWIQIFSCFSLARVTYVRTTRRVLDSSS